MLKIKLLENQRSKIVVKNIIGSFFVKGLSILITLFLIPITVNLLDKEKYGIWLTLFSLVNWFSMMDVGIGNGFRNKFTEAVSVNDEAVAKQLMQTFYAAMGLISFGLLCIYCIIHPFLNWPSILNVSHNVGENLNLIVLSTVSLFCLQLYLKNISTVLLSLQKTSLSNFLIFLGNFFALLGIFVLNYFGKVNLFTIALVYMIAPNLVFIVTSVILFKGSLKQYSPFPIKIFKSRLQSLVGLGFKFFFIQITTIIMFSSDNFIISRLFGPGEVTPYNIAYRLFFTVYTCFIIVMGPFWSAFGEANTRKDKTWIVKSIKKLMLFWLFFSLAIVALYFLSGWIYHIWIGNIVKVDNHLSFQLALFAIILSWTAIFAYYLNGVGKIKVQLYISIFQCICNIPLAIFFAKTMNLNTAGIMLATNLNLLIPAVMLAYQSYLIINDKAIGVWNE